MVQITSAMAAKQLRKLNDQRDALLAMERKAKTFTAAIQEDEESVRPDYNYRATQEKLIALEAKIRKLKHSLNCFNSTYIIPDFGRPPGKTEIKRSFVNSFSNLRNQDRLSGNLRLHMPLELRRESNEHKRIVYHSQEQHRQG